jgi:hypothetical protein
VARSTRHLRPSPALVVAVIALFVALSGIGYAALKLAPNSVKTKSIKNGAVTEAKIANGAVSTPKFSGSATAPNAAMLGGIASTGYQRSCQTGAIKGSLVMNTGSFSSATYVDVVGFNCTGGAVQMRKTAPGNYDVKFVGNDAQGAVVTDSNFPNVANYQTLGAGEFHVNFFNSNTQAASDPTIFALIAF